jgi:NADPH-dependent 2,4-dienoyl-CoA reductase/sulfur reductase-like enzyme
LPGIDGEDVYYLRDARDAEALWKTLAKPRRIAIIGGGVIGLEVASTARTMGHHVDILEAAPRVLKRSAPTAIAGYLADLHARNGVAIRTGVAPQEVLRRNGRVIAVRSADGEVIDVDVVIVGVGIRPQVGLAQSAGLAIDDGIIVDASCRTSSDIVFAAGDVVRMHTKATDQGVRLESWQAAGRQAEIAARAMLGIDDSLYDEVPWTWSDQYDVSMQAVGLMNASADVLELTFPLEEAIFVMTVAGDRILSGCGVAPGDRIGRPIRALRKILETSAQVDLDQIKASTSLKRLSGTLMDASRG